MRVLLDECLNWRLSRALQGHYCVSVMKMGWSGITNGKLLMLAQEQFDVFITGDRNLSFQQHLPRLQIAVVVLAGKSTQLSDTLPLMTRVSDLLETIQPGTVHLID